MSSTLLLFCKTGAHNPAAAGSLVQIQPPQPILRRMPATYRVYVLENRDGRFYVGVTDEVVRRVRQHNSGLSQFTKGCGPWSVLSQSQELTLTEARKLDDHLKRP